MDLEAELSLPDLDEECGKYFTYRHFVECSDTWKQTKVNNIPRQIDTYKAIQDISEKILDPVVEKFGSIVLTYGFSSDALVREIQKKKFPNITQRGDQHAGCELNRNGNPYCNRLGIAVDFYVPGVSSLMVAKWVSSNTAFDRLYYYSAHRPFHVSYGPESSKSIFWMRGFRGGSHVPIRQSPAKFLDF